MNAIVKHEGHVPSFEDSMKEMQHMQEMSTKLAQTKHYQKLGDVGIFTILQKAKSIGLNPLDALNGGMYFVNGKVELAANTMNYLIRQAGHSIVKDEKSTKEICILRGKRADNGDTFTCSFSIEDAKKAGILKNVWLSYPEDMLFARALTRLARQLFPDVCKGCYVEGEIPKDMKEAEYEEVKDIPQLEHIEPIEFITAEEAKELTEILEQCDPEDQTKVKEWLNSQNGGDYKAKMTRKKYPNMLKQLVDRRAKYEAEKAETKKISDFCNGEVTDATTV